MNTTFASFLASLAGLFAAAGAIAAPPPVFPLDDVRPGLQGYGLTVFAGTEVDTFGVEVLGVRRHTAPGGDIILVELSGHGLEISSVAQGMSGSPIYIDGKLLGAVSSGWQGALRPIAGVTPARELLEVSAQPIITPMPRAAARQGLSLFPDSADARALAAGLLPGLLASEAPLSWSDLPSTPIPAAVEPGLGPEALALALVPGLATVAAGDGALSFGLYAAATGDLAATAPNAGTTPTPATLTPATLTPGSACAVVLVSGDAQLGAIGTTSLVDGDRVVLMGHPFLQVGPVDLPLATAEVVTMFPSRVMSFKMASAGQVIGRVTHDQRAGLAGRLGEFATTVPVQVRVEDGDDVRQFSYDVALAPQLTPTLAFWCVYNSLLAGGDDASLQTVTYDLTTRWRTAEGDPLPPVMLSGVTAGPGSLAGVGTDWVPLLRLLMSSRHAALVPTGIDAVMRTHRPVEAALITGVQAPAQVAAGDACRIVVDLERWRGPTQRETLTLTVPADLAPGRYRIGVANASEFFALDAQRAPGLFQDDNLAATLALLAVPRSPSTLVAALVGPGGGFVAGGRELTHLPGSVRRTLAEAPAHAAAPTAGSYLARTERELGLLLQGHAIIDLDVQSPPRPAAQENRP